MKNTTNDPFFNNLHPDILAGIDFTDQQDISDSEEDFVTEEEWEECLRGRDEFDDTEAQMYPRDHEHPGEMDPESW